MRNSFSLLLIAASCAAASAQTPPDAAEKAAEARILEHIQVLASDAFEGRAPGSAGEDKSVAYLQDEFRKLGLAPGNPDGTYIQQVPIVGVTSTTTASFDVGGRHLVPGWINDYVGVTRRGAAKVEVAASDVVFVGYGVDAPEYGWDDYKGVDVRGKTVVMLINDPQVADPRDPGKLDDSMFKGRAMTYYGRWTYKYEEASVKGAAACIIVHETGPAGYPFAVVASSWGRENFDLETPDGNLKRVPVEAWVTLPFAKGLFAAAGLDYAALKAAANRRDFHPVDLHASASFSVTTASRHLASRNVVAKLEGSDPAQRDQYVIYSAHWDHLGRNPKLRGDQIFNGASDNASGCAGLLEIAHRFASLPPAERPKRSLLFLAVTAEEQGLLGSRYYAQNPLYPLTKTVADLNIDRFQVMGRSRDLQGVGYGNSTLDDLAEDVLRTQGRVLVPEADPENGHFYRSDHFEFAKVGVPAFYTNPGLDIVGQPAGYGKMRTDEFYANDYHKVTDEVKPWWDMAGAVQDAAFFFEMGRRLADDGSWPTWKAGCEFKARRDAMMGL